MSHKTRSHISGGRRFLALALAAALPAAAIPVQAAEVIGNGVAPTYDEAYYATLDYYGNLTEGSVVKSYALNGISEFTDYGTYDEVVNLTDGTQPDSKDGTTTFQFNQEKTPQHFYFEGKTSAPFETLPWTISLSYALNGVPTKAEDLAGKTGVVNINLDIMPNENASEYAKNNYTLEAMAMFNQDDILSLKAEGAQVQLVGNLRAVLFLALPGEEQHFTIEVGTDDFAFDGMTFLMVPATLSQLDEIADLSSRKDKLEDNYEKLNKSFDTTLDALNNMTGSLYATANGLDELNQGRETISVGKGSIYEGIDTSLLDMESIAALLDPIAAQIQTASKTITDSKEVLSKLTTEVVSLKTQLTETRNALENLEDDSKKLKDLATDMKNLSGSLDSLERELSKVQSIPTVDSPFGSQNIDDIKKAMPIVKDLHTGFTTNPGAAKTFFEYTCEALWQKYKAENSISLNPGDEGYDEARKAFLEKGGTSQAGKINALHDAWAPDPDAFDFLLENSSSVSELLNDIGETTTEVRGVMNGVSEKTANVVGKLSSICDELDSLYRFIDDASDLAHIGQTATEKMESILDEINSLHTVLSAFEPTAQESLKTLEDLSVTTAGSIRNAQKLVSDTEALARTAGTQLDAGTKKTLDGLADTLRKAAVSLSTTGDIKNAKNNIDEVITDTWHEHTGDVDNLLNMDSTANAVSLTSEKNPSPQSVQVLIRSQEIKVPDEDETQTQAVEADKGTFWSRLGQMFKDFWSAITGIFH